MDQELKKEAQRRIPKLDETQSVVEYSTMLADKAEDSDSPEVQQLAAQQLSQQQQEDPSDGSSTSDDQA